MKGPRKLPSEKEAVHRHEMYEYVEKLSVYPGNLRAELSEEE